MTWEAGKQAPVVGPMVEVQEDLDKKKFYKLLVELLTKAPHT
jgi:hypothetical protein